MNGVDDTSYTNADLCPTKTYSFKAVKKFTRTLTVLMACMLPIGAVLILYLVQDMKTRLIVIACLTGLFSVAVSLFTMATLAEIFQATAAYVHTHTHTSRTYCSARGKAHAMVFCS